MILTGHEIANEVMAGRITIDPFDEKLLNPNSYNISLGSTLKQYDKDVVLDTRHQASTHDIPFPTTGLMLQAGELYLGHTVERIGSEFFVPFIGGRSSTGRLGLFVHITAPLGDIGYLGQWTLQLRPTLSIRMYPGQQIGQMFFVYPFGPISQYHGKYNAGDGPQPFKPADLHDSRQPHAPLDPYCEAPRLFQSLPPTVIAELRDEATDTVRRVLRLSASPSVDFLDVGCGAGFLLGAAEKEPRVSVACGIDSSASVLTYAARRLSKSLLIRDDFLSFSFDRKFEMLAALAFLHLYPKAKVPIFLSKMKSLLSSGGLLVASTSIHDAPSERWEEKRSLPGSWRYRSRYVLEEWRSLFAEEWCIVEEWCRDEIMNPGVGKRWHYIIARPRKQDE